MDNINAIKPLKTWDNSEKAVEVLKGMESNKSPVNAKQSHRGLAPKIRKLALRYPEMSKADIARKVGCHQSNVTGVLKSFLAGSDKSDLDQYQANKGDVFDSLAMRALLSITPAKLEKASAPALMMVAGTAFDKSQLARGAATSINVNVLMDVVEALRARGPVRQVVESSSEGQKQGS